MKKFDHNGLLLAEYQGKLFEKSVDLDCSTAVFLRRFLHSDFVKKMDKNDASSLTLDVNEGMLLPYKQLNDVYYAFHTQDPEWCVRSLLEMNGKNEDIFDNNLRLKAVISAKWSGGK